MTLDDTRHDLDVDYDALGRLFDFDALGAAPLSSQDFSYDANGNRTSITEGAHFPYTIIPNSNRLASVAGPVARTLSYDAAGNITGDGTTTYSYDDRGRLVTAGMASYVHNGLGQRVKKDNGTVTLFAYDDAGNVIGEYDALGNPVREHVWFEGAPVAVIVGSDVHYVHTDHLGTPRAITASGTVIWRWESDPFGATAADEDPDGDLVAFTYNLRFPGQYYDSESGLHYNYFRTYDPSTGRYLESDPIGLAAELNSYAYALQAPLGRVDIFGLDTDIETFPHGLNLGVGSVEWYVSRIRDAFSKPVKPTLEQECAANCIVEFVALVPAEYAFELTLEKLIRGTGTLVKRGFQITGYATLMQCLAECAINPYVCEAR